MASLEEVKGGASKKRKDGSKGGLSITDYSELLAVTDKTKNQKKRGKTFTEALLRKLCNIYHMGLHPSNHLTLNV